MSNQLVSFPFTLSHIITVFPTFILRSTMRIPTLWSILVVHISFCDNVYGQTDKLEGVPQCAVSLTCETIDVLLIEDR